MTDPFEVVRDREYPGLDGIFLNAASWGLLPRSTIEAVDVLTRRRGRAGGVRDEALDAILDRSRRAAARLIGADRDEVALTSNTSFGVNLAAACAAAGPPGTVIVSAGEFPANVLPFLPLRKRGFSVEVVPAGVDGLPDPEAIEQALDRDGVRLFALSQVQFATGYRADLAAFGRRCRERGILFAVDAIQGLGAVPLDVRDAGIDLLACGGQKWLCSPWGSGFAFVDRGLWDRFDPPMVSWLSMEGATDFSSPGGYAWSLLPDARRFELATLGIQDQLGMATSLELILELGPAPIEAHLRKVQDPLLDWIDARTEARLVTPRDPERRAGIVAFRLSGEDRAVRALTSAGVDFAVREGMIRLAPHFYNTVEEMRAVVEILDRAV